MNETEYKYLINVKERIPIIEHLLFTENKPYIHKGLSDSQMSENYIHIKNYLEENYLDILNDKEKFQKLVNWTMNNIYVVIITSEKRSAYDIFETMNNRGIKVNPSDIFKGYILSNISENKQEEANIEWKKYQHELAEIEDEQKDDNESRFLKALLKAKYARDDQENEEADCRTYDDDFSSFNKDEYPKRFRDNSNQFGFQKENDYYNFVMKTMPKYIKIYRKIKDAERVFNKKIPNILYLNLISSPYKYEYLFSAISEDDTDDIINKKLNIIASYLDIFTFTNVLKNKQSQLSYPFSSKFILKARNLNNATVSQLAIMVKKEANKMLADTLYSNNISGLYCTSYKNNIVWLLARIYSFMDENIEDQNTFLKYCSKKSGYDLEHILSQNGYEHYSKYFASEEIYTTTRNHIACMLIVLKSKNRSLQDKTYEEKIQLYGKDHPYIETLLEQPKNHPVFKKFLEDKTLYEQALPEYDESFIEEREIFIESLTEQIWNITNFDKYIASQEEHGDLKMELKIKVLNDINLKHLQTYNKIKGNKIYLETDEGKIYGEIINSKKISVKKYGRGTLTGMLKTIIPGSASSGWQMWKHDGKRISELKEELFKEIKDETHEK